MKYKTDKKLILESLLQEAWEQELFEAAHDNHPYLSKTARNNGSYKDGMEIQKNRNTLAKDIKDFREKRDTHRKEGWDGIANLYNIFAKNQIKSFRSI